MKVSQRLDYACRVAVQLAMSYDGSRVTRIDDLAEKEKVSPHFLAQILNDLRRAGMVASRRGKTGGYTLARPPGEISLADLALAIEGPLLATDGDALGESGEAVRQAWKHAGRQLEEHLRSRTLAGLAAEVSRIDFSI